MPFVMNQKCFATPAEANAAFQSNFPILDVNFTSLVSSSVNASGVLNYSVSTRPITNNTVSSRTGTMQLASCSTPDPLPTEFDAVVAGALWVFFFSFVLTLYLISKSSGAILLALRRF